MPDSQEAKLKRAGEKKAARLRAYMAKTRRAKQDIGRPDYWEDVDFEAVKACERDYKLFCETYFPHLFYLPWADCHLKTIDLVERAVLDGESLAIALPRGYGKTTLCRVAVIWAGVYGHRRYMFLLGANNDKAEKNLDSVKAQLLNTANVKFQVDFWELLWPVVQAEGEPRACNGQKYNGQSTGLEWQTDHITLPHNPSHAFGGNGARIETCGILGSFLGANWTDHEGRQVRPDCLIPDDPQTPMSAKSKPMTKSRLKVITSDARGMKDVTKSMSILVPCTVIAPDDLSDQLTDPKQHPEFRGIRTAMIEEFPKSSKWDRYAKLYKEQQKSHKATPATDFYEKHREEMDAGADVSWEHGFDPDSAISTLEYGMQYLASNPQYFWAQCQNDPLAEEDTTGDFEMLEPGEIVERINNRPRYVVPEQCETLTAYVDVHDDLLYYAVCAWRDDFTGYVVDYGAWPEQFQAYFTLRGASTTMGQKYPEHSTKEGVIYAGLGDLFSELIARDWRRADGEPMHLEIIAPDQRYKTSTVMQACAEHEHSDRLQPAFGQYVGARHKPLSQYERGGRNRGDKIGEGWILKRRMPDNPMRSLLIDTNFWKTRWHERIKLPVGEPGGITLFGENPARHRMLAEHATSEYGTATEGHGRRLIEWKLPPGAGDNHLFDCLVGCNALASFCGVGGGGGRTDDREPVSLSDLWKETHG